MSLLYLSIVVIILLSLDQEYDGKLFFTVAFGANTPRGPTAVKGWLIKFEGLVPIPGTHNFEGKCGHNCDGSGTALKMRNVKLLRYRDLTPGNYYYIIILKY